MDVDQFDGECQSADPAEVVAEVAEVQQAEFGLDDAGVPVAFEDDGSYA